MQLLSVPTVSDILKNRPSLKAILWDMDGTLLNSEFLHALATKDIFEPYFVGFSGDTNEIERRCKGLSDPQLIEFLSQFCNIKISLEEFVERKNRRFIDLASKADLKKILIPEIEFFLKEIRQHKLKLALVTSSEREVVDYLLERLELNAYFDLVLTRTETIQTKPSPLPYQIAMQKLLLSPTECLIFEDSLVGLEAAKKSMSEFYQVKWFEDLLGVI